MAAIEVSTFEVTVTKGTDVTDAVLATVGGAIQSITIHKIERIGDATTYQIVVIHDATGTTAIEFTKREVTIVKGATDLLDQVVATTAGNTEGIPHVSLLEQDSSNYLYEVFIVHLGV